MNKHTEQLKNIITKKKITPKPRIYFLIKRILFWSFVIIAILISSVFIGRLIYNITTYLQYTPLGTPLPMRLLIFIRMLPIIWIVSTIFMITVIWYSIRQTKKGYKYPTLMIFGINILLVASIALFYQFTGTNKKIDHLVANIPGYISPRDNLNKVWNQANAGRLEGIIIEVNEDTMVLQEYFLPPKRFHKRMKDKNNKRRPLPNKNQRSHSNPNWNDSSLFNNKYPSLKRKNMMNSNTDINIKRHPLEFSEENLHGSFSGKSWIINISNAHKFPYIVIPDNIVKVVGNKLDDEHFLAEYILPYKRLSRHDMEEICETLNSEIDTNECNQVLILWSKH